MPNFYSSRSESGISKLLIILFITILMATLFLSAYYFWVVYSNKGKANLTQNANSDVAKLLDPSSVPEFQGTIVEMNVDRSKNVRFSFRLLLEDIKRGDPEIFSFNDYELKIMKVIDSSGKVVSYDSLRVGQKIKVNHYPNLEILVVE